MKHGLPFQSWKNRSDKGKNMDVILREDELKVAVQEYLQPKMKHHKIKQVTIREVRINNSKRMEVIAELEEIKEPKK